MYSQENMEPADLIDNTPDLIEDLSEQNDFQDNMTDVEADADVLVSVGWGTDEDYGSAADML